MEKGGVRGAKCHADLPHILKIRQGSPYFQYWKLLGKKRIGGGVKMSRL